MCGGAAGVTQRFLLQGMLDFATLHVKVLFLFVVLEWFV